MIQKISYIFNYKLLKFLSIFLINKAINFNFYLKLKTNLHPFTMFFYMTHYLNSIK